MSEATGTGITGDEGVTTIETARLISSDRVEGTPVYSRAGDCLGSIYTLMIDKVSGQVSYVVMSFGGILGIGERYHPLPWKTLTYDTDLSGYVADVSRAQLEAAPSCGRDETPWTEPGYGRSVYDYYGLAYPGIM
ncbi:PRC-barrel domain-containing protein [Belnapia moabensis]|uniref:PRC-barrel domain-containing protein n=1 Tax=Belnapia moabensis TaxID=365533 RepID=UPI0005B996D8|nr:PRC-barrel domain-containing protein [Belnapia moabensis]